MTPSGKIYMGVSILGKKYFCHRIVVALKCGRDPGPTGIDHRDGNTTNNDSANLRRATATENLANTPRINKHGFRGVHYHAKSGRWNARIHKEGVCISLGYFDTKEEAAGRYLKAAEGMFGEFALHLR
jgi:hypothetical protein